MTYEYVVEYKEPLIDGFKRIETYSKLEKGDLIKVHHLNSTGYCTYWVVDDVLHDLFGDDCIKLSPLNFKMAKVNA